MKVMTLNALAKRIAVRLRLKAGDVRTVLASRKSALPRAVVSQITEMARTLIHEELVRLDAQHHTDDKTAASHGRMHRGRTPQ